jgi:hypothetical protein
MVVSGLMPRKSKAKSFTKGTLLTSAIRNAAMTVEQNSASLIIPAVITSDAQSVDIRLSCAIASIILSNAGKVSVEPVLKRNFEHGLER